METYKEVMEGFEKSINTNSKDYWDARDAFLIRSILAVASEIDKLRETIYNKRMSTL